MDTEKNTKHAGFTIIELMIATVVFSMVLLVCAYAIIHIGRMYYKGVIIARTQDVSKRVIDDIADTIRFGGVEALEQGDDASRGKCFSIGNVSYRYVLNEQYKPSDGTLGLQKDRSSCSDSEPNNPKQILSENMRVSEIEVKKLSDDMTWSISVRVSYGDDDVFEVDGDSNPDYAICRGSLSGGQFCASSRYTVKVVSRVN